MTAMSSGQAHGWLFLGLVNDHLRELVPDEWDKNWLAARGRRIDDITSYCPECCGPCGSIRDYWNTPRGRADAQAYVRQLSRENRNWTWCPDGVIDWAQIEARMAVGFCINHEKEN